MKFLMVMGDFLLSNWIWNFTFGWWHNITSFFVMFVLLRSVMRRSRSKSFVVSFCAQVVTLCFLSALVVGGLMGLAGWKYEPLAPSIALPMMGEFYASLWLGISYSIMQTGYFLIGWLIWQYNAIAYVVLAWLSNMLGASLSFFIVRMLTNWNYTG